MKNPSKRLLCLGTALTGSFLLSLPVLAQRSRLFENPGISGLWVDACVVEYGNVNCSEWAKKQAANAFCRNQGYTKSISAKTRNEGPKHQTWRLVYAYQDGEKTLRYERCNKCGVRLVDVDCEG